MRPITISANLGFLWTDLPLPDRVRAAGKAGFDAVEVHYPYDTPAGDLRDALSEAGLPLISLNTRIEDGGFGLSAVPGAEDRARKAIDEAVEYGQAVGARAVHVMAGVTADTPDAHEAYADNLRHAAARAGAAGLAVLIEPLNQTDVPGYFLSDFDVAGEIARRTGVRVMLDCYHAAMEDRSPLDIWGRHGEVIGHVQFADCPGRGAPGTGRIDLPAILKGMRKAGYDGPFGAEYRPDGPVESGLAWMTEVRGQS